MCSRAEVHVTSRLEACTGLQNARHDGEEHGLFSGHPHLLGGQRQVPTGEKLLEEDDTLGVSAAWDNNDTDPKKTFGCATHLGQIGASAHQALKGARLGLESSWTKVKDVTLDTLKKGRDAAANDNVLKSWKSLLFAIVGNSPHYLRPGEDESCLEVEIQRKHHAAKCKVKSTNLFLQAGSTKRLADNEAALSRNQRCCHAGVVWIEVDGRWRSVVKQRVLVEGDEETYRIMVQLKRSNPEKYKWMVPHPGGWHIMLHVTKALMTRYYGAGIEEVAKSLARGRRQARRRRQQVQAEPPVTYEAMWWIVIERYTKAKQEEAAQGAVGTGAGPEEGSSSLPDVPSAAPGSGTAASSTGVRDDDTR